MLNDKEKRVLEAINEYIKEHEYSPTIRDLCQILGYKSTKTIWTYLHKLQEKKLINYKHNKKRNITLNKINSPLIAINTSEKLTLLNKECVIYHVKSNVLKEFNILKNEYLIVDTSKRPKNNQLGLFIINNEYRIMKFNYKDGYYILNDNETEILHKVNIIGKVVGLYKTI